jgi:hypothetical protein
MESVLGGWFRAKGNRSRRVPRLPQHHPHNSFRARPGVSDRFPRSLIQRKSLLMSRKAAQENLAARTARRQFLDKSGTSPVRSNKVALVSPRGDFEASDLSDHRADGYVSRLRLTPCAAVSARPGGLPWAHSSCSLEGVVQVVPVRPSTWTAGLTDHRGSYFFDDPRNLIIVLSLRSARLNCREYFFFECYVSCDRIQGR